MITDTDILLDLEGTRGIDNFLSTMDCGFDVPKCFAARVIKIIKDFYDVDMIAVETGARRSGTFCLMDYNDITVKIINIEMVDK
tara:strand:- start:276 stop:527 length:252 start_codon:yes stop_codon:yes gene_type:complete